MESDILHRKNKTFFAKSKKQKRDFSNYYCNKNEKTTMEKNQ